MTNVGWSVAENWACVVNIKKLATWRKYRRLRSGIAMELQTLLSCDTVLGHGSTWIQVVFAESPLAKTTFPSEVVVTSPMIEPNLGEFETSCVDQGEVLPQATLSQLAENTPQNERLEPEIITLFWKGKSSEPNLHDFGFHVSFWVSIWNPTTLKTSSFNSFSASFFEEKWVSCRWSYLPTSRPRV